MDYPNVGPQRPVYVAPVIPLRPSYAAPQVATPAEVAAVQGLAPVAEPVLSISLPIPQPKRWKPYVIGGVVGVFLGALGMHWSMKDEHVAP